MNNLSLYLLTVLIWGSTWIAVEFQIPESVMDPNGDVIASVVAAEVSVFYRYAIASFVIFIWCWARKLNLKFDLKTHLIFMGLGFLMFCLNYLCVYIGQGYITSALMAIVYSMVSWMNIFNARLFFGTRSGPRVIFGAVVGMAGLCLMFWPSIKDLSLTDSTVIGALIGMVGAYLASLGNMMSQFTQKRNIAVMETNAFAMFYGAMFTGLICLGRGQTFTVDLSFPYLASLFYLAVFGSVIAFWSYLTLLGRIGANKAGYATIAFPVIAILLSVVFEGLNVTPVLIVGMLMVLAGNVSILNRKPV
ncbi:MAG: DMT family transporter [Maricaulaceae bacterium]